MPEPMIADWPVSAERRAKGLYWERAWNLVSGCTPVSRACDHCWAARESAMREHNPNPKISDRHRGLTDHKSFAGDLTTTPRFNGRIRINEAALQLPMRTRKPAVWSIWTDLFHPDVPFEFAVKAFCVMDYCRHHTFLVCTKRPERMLEFAHEVEIGMLYMAGKDDPTGRDGGWDSWPLPNVIPGTTIEDQRTSARCAYLVQVPAYRRFLSMEPLLGDVRLNTGIYSLGDGLWTGTRITGGNIHWITAGGESGPGARELHPAWIRRVRDQAEAAGIPFHFKQWGEWLPWGQFGNRVLQCHHQKTVQDPDLGDFRTYRVTKKKAGRLLDGVLHDEFPAPVEAR